MTTQPSTESAMSHKPARRALLPTAITAIVVVVAGATWYAFGRFYEQTDDAYVSGDVVIVTAEIGGTVTAIEADDTDQVSAGLTLVKLDRVDRQIDFDRAQAALAKATRQVRIQFAQVQQLEAELEQRRVDVQRAQADVTRRAQLQRSGAVSGEELSHVNDVLKGAQASLVATQQALLQRRALVDGTTMRTHPDIVSAAANLHDAYIALARTDIPAPVTGVVTKRTVQLGQHIGAGTALMSVVPLDALWVDANFRESQLGSIRVGQKAEMTADVYGHGVVFHGTVIGVDPGTGSAFSLLPAQNATGNWIKVTQRVPVRIAFDDRTMLAQHSLRIGLSMRVKVDTRDQGGQMVSSGQPRLQAYSTMVFDRQMQAADALVENVIRNNEGSGLSLSARAR